LRCRECGNSFDQWSWENPVCPACLGQASPGSDADAAPPRPDNANIINESPSSLVSSESALDNFSIGRSLTPQAVDDILNPAMSTFSSVETDIDENEIQSDSHLADNIGGGFENKEMEFKSLADSSVLDIDTNSPMREIPVSIKADEAPTENEDSDQQSDLTPKRSEFLEAGSNILDAGTSDLLGVGMTEKELENIEHRSTYEIPSHEPLVEIQRLDLSHSEESFFENTAIADDPENADAEFLSALVTDSRHQEVETESFPARNDLKESTMPKWGDDAPNETEEELAAPDDDLLSVADFFQDDITVLSSSEKIPEGIPVAGEFVDEKPFPAQDPVGILIEEPEDIPVAKRFFHEQDDEFQPGDPAIPSEKQDSIRAAEVAMPGELRSHIQSFESPSGRYSIDFAEGKFLRMEMIAEDMGGWNVMVFITLLTIAMIAVATGPFFIFFLPFLFLYGLRLAIRIFATEKLYVEEKGIRHEILLVPGFAFRWEREFTPDLTILKTSDPFRFFRSRDKSGKRKGEMLFLAGDDWRERVGFLTDEQEARWLASHLHRCLRKIRYVH
jgi:hypothetical protein